MKRKKVIACLMSLCLAGGALSGCSAKKSEDAAVSATEEAKETAGKYVEEEIEIPKDAGDILIKNTDGAIEVYGTGEEGDRNIKGYVQQEDGSWKEKDMSWLGKDAYLSALAYAPDGTQYAVMYEEEKRVYLMKRVDDKTGEEVAFPEFDGLDVTNFNGDFFPYEINMAFLENGSLVLSAQKEVRIYDISTGKRLNKIEAEAGSRITPPIAVSGNQIALPNKEGDAYAVWDAEKMQELGTCKCSTKMEETEIALDEKGTLYTISKKGISHLQTGGSIEEQLMTGDSMTMGNPNSYMTDWFLGNANDFYALYYQMDTGSGVVKHYYFDENAPTNVEHTLDVYSLAENAALRQAVNDYNQAHDDVELIYKTGAEDAESSREDKIRALNTELLNQNGADILLLDDLPAEEFQEKGILMDLQSVLGDKIKDGSIQKNIAECYQKEDGSVYGMPIRYGVPLLRANEEYQKAFASLDAMEEWLNENPKQSFMDYGTFSGINRLFLRIFYDEIFDEEGKVRSDKCEQFLTVVKEVGERANAEGDDGEFMTVMSKYTDEMYLSDWLNGDVSAAAEGTGVQFTEVDSKIAVADIYTALRDQMNPIETVNDMFVPRGIVAVNAKTQEAEVAKDFVEYLFSEEVQEDENTVCGLPMNQNAERAMIENTQEAFPEGEKGYKVTVFDDGEGGEEKIVEATEPIREEVEQVFDFADELKEPQKGDATVLDMVYEEAKLYYGGTQELDQTVQGIVQKLDTYHAE